MTTMNRQSSTRLIILILEWNREPIYLVLFSFCRVSRLGHSSVMEERSEYSRFDVNQPFAYSTSPYTRRVYIQFVCSWIEDQYFFFFFQYVFKTNKTIYSK
jgi:hypothetical protein